MTLCVRLRRVAAGVLALTMVGVGLVAAGPTPRAAAAGPAFTRTIVLARNHLNPDGTDSTVDPRIFTVSVDSITGLRNRQQIHVSWSGAHPTGGIAADLNGPAAVTQEYPVVLMECRGIDSPLAPGEQRVDPTTCWTQTAAERWQQDPTNDFPAWRSDRYASPEERTAAVNVPDPAAGCPEARVSRFTPFVAMTPTPDDPLATTTFYEGPNGCGGIPPDGVSAVDPAAPPGNTTYGVTRLDGTGDASFVVWTDQQNASLGCSMTMPCTLEIIPIEGISCDPSGAALPPGDENRPAPGPNTDAASALCESTGKYAPGELAHQDLKGDPAVDGASWWSASNWRNRIAVPLGFATPGNICDILDQRIPVDVYGSELMNEATTQWAALFCLDPRRFKFRHVRTGEPQAKAALASGTVSAVLESQPPPGGYAVPTVNAPVAVTGFAITYTIDDAQGKPYTQLKLNPRLLVKLLTESYWALPSLRDDYARLKAGQPYRVMATNPQDITRDPEFKALNPKVGETRNSTSAATLLTLSGDSDVLYALSQYIAADPEAIAFLAGEPDPWGMVVNPAYKHLGLPLAYWPLLDTFLSPDIDLSGCLPKDPKSGVVANPVPILPLVAAPVASLTTIAQNMEYAMANSNTFCKASVTPGGVVQGYSLKPLGHQQLGYRFVLGLASLGDTELYGLRPASLQSYAANPSATKKYTSDKGRVFMAPSDFTMRKAMELATVDETTKTWPIPYDKLRTKQGELAYPGTMVVYAAVPTTGLDPTTAAELAELLRFASAAGQVPGLDNGQLPPGYLPMTAANGLAPLAFYTQRAADSVAAQQGETPAVNLPLAAPAAPSASPPTPPAAGPEPSVSPSPELPPWTPGLAAMSYTHSARSSLAGWALPAVALAFLAAVLLAGFARARVSAQMFSSIEARLARLAEMRRNGNGTRR